MTLQEVMVWHDGANPTETMLTDAYTNVGEVDWSPDVIRTVGMAGCGVPSW